MERILRHGLAPLPEVGEIFCRACWVWGCDELKRYTWPLRGSNVPRSPLPRSNNPQSPNPPQTQAPTQYADEDLEDADEEERVNENGNIEIIRHTPLTTVDWTTKPLRL